MEETTFANVTEEETFGDAASTNGSESYEPETRPKEDEVPPKPHYPRSNGKDLFTWIARCIGTALIQSGKDVPAGRVVSFQAPITGKRIDGLIADTWIDTLLQPLFRKTEQLEGLGTIIALPIAVSMMHRSPAFAPMIGQAMRSLVYATFDELAPILLEEKKKDRRKYRTIADDPEYKALFGLDRNDDPFEAFMGSIFSTGEAEPGEQPEDS